jgi:hypothetical protein
MVYPPDVPYRSLAAEVEVPLHRPGLLGPHDALVHQPPVAIQQEPEDPIEGVGPDAALAEHERLAGRHPQLHGRDTSTVLAAVVLLLHEQEQLHEAPQRGSVALLVVLERLSHPYQRDAAFVPEGIAHRRLTA